ncbi:MAG: hypothetical protein ACTHOB_00595 [Ginsengibacter sp.]
MWSSGTKQPLYPFLRPRAVFQPAGKMEDFFKQIGEGVEKNMSQAQKLQFREDHGIKLVGGPIDYLKQ